MKTWRRTSTHLLAICLACTAGCQSPKAKTHPAWLGINTMLGYPDFGGAFPSAKTTAQERERYLQLTADLGSPPIRDLVMSWARIQPSADAPYDFSLSDELITQAQSRQIDVLALCWGMPEWAVKLHGSGAAFDFGIPALEQEQPFRQFVRAFVERYDGDGHADMPGLKQPLKAYEFLQEMEDIPSQEYAYWLRVFYETVKDADTQAVVSLGSLRSPGMHLPGQPAGDYPRYLEQVLAASSLSGPAFPYFDVVSFHSYPESYPDGHPFDESLAYIRQSLAARSLTKPIWLTEFGSDGASPKQQQQANRLVQWALRAKGLGVERAYIYCLWDYHWASSKDRPEHLGLLAEATADLEPVRKPAYSALRTLLGELAQRPDVTRRDENLYALAGEGETAFAIWQSGNVASDQRFLTADWWEVRMLSGQQTRQQGTQIELTATPIFVEKVKSPFLGKSQFMKEPNPFILPEKDDAKSKP